MESFVAASDLHGDRQDKLAVKAFKLFVEEYKPRLRFFLGDIFDLRAIRTGADREERQHSMLEDFDAGMEFLEWYRPQVITLGNHDQRLWDAIEKDGMRKNGPIPDLARLLVDRFDRFVRKHKVKVLPWDKRKGVYRYNGLAFTHGFSNGRQAARDMARIYGNVLFGHGHAIDRATEPGGEPRVARMIGGLMQKDLTYNRAQLSTMRQQHGWAYGAFHGRNQFTVLQAELKDGQFAFAEKLRAVKVN